MSEHVIAVAVWTAWKLSTTVEIVLSSLNCLGFNRKQNCTTPSPEYGNKETNGIFIQKASKKEKHKRFIGVIVWLVGTMDMQNKNIFLISYNYLFFFFNKNTNLSFSIKLYTCCRILWICSQFRTSAYKKKWKSARGSTSVEFSTNSDWRMEHSSALPWFPLLNSCISSNNR